MKSFRLFAFAASLAVLMTAGMARAATFTVTSLADTTAAGTLRTAINLANESPGSTITFNSGLTGVITLTSALPTISTSMTIQGNTLPHIAIDGANAFRPFDIDASGEAVSISNLIIQEGNDSADNQGGGAIHVAFGAVTLTNLTINENNSGYNGGGIYSLYGYVSVVGCTISNNSAVAGGGIYNDGTLAITNSTISGNTAGQNGGGGLNNNGNGNATIIGSTFSGNTALSNGGGILNFVDVSATNCTFTLNTAAHGAAVDSPSPGQAPSSVSLINCTISANNGAVNAVFVGGQGTLVNDIVYGDSSTELTSTGTTTATNCDIQGGVLLAGVVDGGGNISADPLLGTLALNSGLTQTLALGSGSPALGAGTSVGAPSTDQRGVTRPNPPSIGAYDGAAVPIVPHFFPAGVTLFSTPTDYAGISLSNVLGYSNPVLAVWRPETNPAAYAVTPNAPADQIRIGRGYWVRIPAGGATITVAGTTPDTVPDIVLNQGWNQIGCPQTTAIALSAVTVIDSNNQSHTFAAASDNGGLGLVHDPLYAWQPGDIAYEVVTGASGSLEPYRGYWIYAIHPCTLHFVPAVQSSPFAGTYAGTDSATVNALGQQFSGVGNLTITIDSSGHISGSNQNGSLTGTIDAQGNTSIAVQATVDGVSGQGTISGVLALNGSALTGTLSGTLQAGFITGQTTDVISMTKQ